MPQVKARHDCLHFNGYRPCKFKRLCNDCPHYAPMGKRVLVIHLGAMGAVLASTPVLPALKRKYPRSQVSWLTSSACLPLLSNNPLIDRLFTYNQDAVAALLAEKFDLLLCADKEVGPCSLAANIKAGEKHGFAWGEKGNIIPLSEKSRYAFELGIDDGLKFRRNTKSQPQVLTESVGLEWCKDGYILELSPAEIRASKEYRLRAGLKSGEFIVGLNTGCAALFPYKKFTVARHVEIIRLLLKKAKRVKVLLLGGRDETKRNKEIAASFRGKVIETPTREGLRRGIIYENCCQLVVSGDTLGMHIAIGLGKLVVAWFGLTCEQEIELYDRGVKLVADVPCRPCWRQECDEKVKCFDKVDAGTVVEAVLELKRQHCRVSLER